MTDLPECERRAGDTRIYTVTVPSGSFTNGRFLWAGFGYPGGDLTVPIDAHLGPGHYWVSVEPGGGAYYYWWIRRRRREHAGKWEDPTDYWGSGCPSMDRHRHVFRLHQGIYDGAPGKLDLMFSVNGTSSTDKQVGAASVCNGSYNGFGTNVVVPAGATCTILPGGGVAYDLKVMKGGTLNMDGASIGHDLTVDGSATICDSDVGHDLTADGAPHDRRPSLHRQRHRRRPHACKGQAVERPSRHNSVVPTSTSSTTMAASPSPTTRRPGHEREDNGSPTTVSDNTVGANAICKNNKGQTGSGNTAGNNNTCPRSL